MLSMEKNIPEIIERLDCAYVVRNGVTMALCMDGEAIFVEPIPDQVVETPRQFVAYLIQKVRNQRTANKTKAQALNGHELD